jgi:hypothetical protein
MKEGKKQEDSATGMEGMDPSTIIPHSVNYF